MKIYCEYLKSNNVTKKSRVVNFGTINFMIFTVYKVIQRVSLISLRGTRAQFSFKKGYIHRNLNKFRTINMLLHLLKKEQQPNPIIFPTQSAS